MPCHAKACGQIISCRSVKICEKIWHDCLGDDMTHALGNSRLVCETCGASWTLRRINDDVADRWYRDPLPRQVRKGRGSVQPIHARSA